MTFVMYYFGLVPTLAKQGTVATLYSSSVAKALLVCL